MKRELMKLIETQMTSDGSVDMIGGVVRVVSVGVF